jgi:hypothetical protein
MKTTNTATALRLAAVAAVVAGVSYVLVGVLHPPNVSSAVTTTRWQLVHYLACVMAFCGLVGITGVYARQLSRGAGWLTHVGYALLSLWFALILGFSFVEAFVLPHIADTAPGFVDGWMSMFDGSHSNADLGALPVLWTITAPLYILGGLIFGVTVFRSGVPARGAGLLLAAGTLPHPWRPSCQPVPSPRSRFRSGWRSCGSASDCAWTRQRPRAKPSRTQAPAHPHLPRRARATTLW